MGKKKKDPFQHQLKTVQNLAERIELLIRKHRSLNGTILKSGKVDLSALAIVFRTVIEPNTSTLYEEGHHGRGKLIDGVRECDFKFRDGNPNWIEASSEHGLSFSSTTSHTISTLKFLGKFQKKGTKMNCAYWVFKDTGWLPDGLEFIQDPDNEEHYLLAVTEDMLVSTLVEKLKYIGIRMSVLDIPLEAFKDA